MSRWYLGYGLSFQGFFFFLQREVLGPVTGTISVPGTARLCSVAIGLGRWKVEAGVREHG